jgi:hypothetical protein
MMTTIALFVCIILVFLYVFYVDSKTKHLDFLQEFANKHNSNCRDLEEMRKLVLEMFEKHNGIIDVAHSIANKQEELVFKHNEMDAQVGELVTKHNDNVKLINEVLIPTHNELAQDFETLKSNFIKLVEVLDASQEKIQKSS